MGILPPYHMWSHSIGNDSFSTSMDQQTLVHAQAMPQALIYTIKYQVGRKCHTSERPGNPNFDYDLLPSRNYFTIFFPPPLRFSKLVQFIVILTFGIPVLNSEMGLSFFLPQNGTPFRLTLILFFSCLLNHFSLPSSFAHIDMILNNQQNLEKIWNFEILSL